jgi:hypothetical protein
MSPDPGANLQRLRDENLIAADDVPESYAAVAESLTPDELEVIVAVRKRLEEAQRTSGVEPEEIYFAP